MFGLTTTRRLRAELAAARAETDQQRRRAEAAEGRAATAEFNREQVLHQLAEADAANRRLHGRNLELGERLSALAESDPDHLAALEQQLANVRRELAAEKKRVERLQRRYDDAVGLTRSGIQDSSRWQPGYQKPTPEVAS
jgi:uncharacterized protein YhaN